MKKTKLHNKQSKNKNTIHKHNYRSSRNTKKTQFGRGIFHTKLKIKTGVPLSSERIDNLINNENTTKKFNGLKDGDNQNDQNDQNDQTDQTDGKLHLLSGDINSILFRYRLLRKIKYRRHQVDYKELSDTFYKIDYSLLKNQFVGYKLYYYNQNPTQETTALEKDLLKKKQFSPLEVPEWSFRAVSHFLFDFERSSPEFKSIINSITAKIKLKIQDTKILDEQQLQLEGEMKGIITRMIRNGEIESSMDKIREMCAQSVSYKSYCNNNYYGFGQTVREILSIEYIEESIIKYCIGKAIREAATDVLKHFFIPTTPTLTGEFEIKAQTIVDLENVKSIYYDKDTKTKIKTFHKEKGSPQSKEVINGVMILNFHDQPNTPPKFGINLNQNLHLSIHPAEKIIICIVTETPPIPMIVNPTLQKFLLSIKQNHPTVFNKNKVKSFNVHFLEKPDTLSKDFHIPLVSTKKDMEKVIAVPISYDLSESIRIKAEREAEERRVKEQEKQRRLLSLISLERGEPPPYPGPLPRELDRRSSNGSLRRRLGNFFSRRSRDGRHNSNA